MRSMQETYLSLLRWDTPLHVLVISGIVLAVVSPIGQELTALTLFLGMILRTRSCAIRPSVMPPGLGRGFIILLPLWPALVAIDDVWSWMQRVGFASVFRISVTLVLFALSWAPFLERTVPVTVALLVAGAASAILREYTTGYWYLAPTLIPLGIAGAQW